LSKASETFQPRTRKLGNSNILLLAVFICIGSEMQRLKKGPSDFILICVFYWWYNI